MIKITLYIKEKRPFSRKKTKTPTTKKGKENSESYRIVVVTKVREAREGSRNIYGGGKQRRFQK